MCNRDAFAGGFLSGVVLGESLEKCIDRGQWLAALSIRELGPSYISLPLKIPDFTLLITSSGTPSLSKHTTLSKGGVSKERAAFSYRLQLGFNNLGCHTQHRLAQRLLDSCTV